MPSDAIVDSKTYQALNAREKELYTKEIYEDNVDSPHFLPF